MRLNATNVEQTILKCLFSEEESEGRSQEELLKEAVVAEGVRSRFAFKKENVEKNKDNIIAMLNDLPETFMESVGGGWHFSNACMNKDGHHWGEHISMDHLICLGLAINKVAFTLPREAWDVFPSGLPYFVVKDKS